MSVTILHERAQAEGWELQLEEVVQQEPTFFFSVKIADRTYERAGASIKDARTLAAAAALLDVAGEEAADPVARLQFWAQTTHCTPPTFAKTRELPRVFEATARLASHLVARERSTR